VACRWRGMQLLAQTARVSGLDAAMSAALTPWRKARAVHDLAVALALAADGDCPADVAVVRTGAALFGPVASDPEVVPGLVEVEVAVPGSTPAVR
jgi:hypothetical protein